MKQTVSFTGHRPEKINVPISTIVLKLDETLQALYKPSDKTFLSGMARGFDMLAAEAVLRFRENHPDVKLIAVVPFVGQELKYAETEKRRYTEICRSADSVVMTSDQEYTHDAYFIRNDYLVANSSLIVCYYAGTKGGTMYTVNRAQINRVPVLNLFEY